MEYTEELLREIQAAGESFIPPKRILFYGHMGEIWYKLSNQYPCITFIKGKGYKSIEHYYQSQKYVGTLHEEKIMALKGFKQVAQYVSSIRDPVRGDWESIKYGLMKHALQCKFTQNPNLKEELIRTGNTLLVEDNPNDEYWGLGKHQNGLNIMGKLLMEIRSELARQISDGIVISPGELFEDFF